MYAPDGYLAALRANDTAEVTVQISTGTGIDETAWDDFETVQATSLPMSSVPQMSDKVYVLTEGLATFEGDGIPTSPSAGMIAPPLQETEGIETGIWSETISDGSGAINWTFSIVLDVPHTSALTVYTAGPGIVSASVVFYNGSSEVARGSLTINSDGTLVWPTAVTFTKADVTVASIDTPYCHVRIAELDFGAMVPIPTDYLGDSIQFVQEADVLQKSIPLQELDFSVINIDGEWDEDSPDSRNEAYLLGALVTASLRTSVGGSVYTIPLGRFTIAEKRADGDLVRFVCYDLRTRLRNRESSIVLSTMTSLGTTLSDLLLELGIPHVVEASVREMFPTENAELTEGTALDSVLEIQQRYGVWLVPRRDGFIHVVTGDPGEEYGELPREQLIDHPKPANSESYNYISVRYGESEYTIDLRQNPSELKSILSYLNPLIVTEAQAGELAETIRDSLYSKCQEIEAIGDGSLDVMDTLSVYGRHSDTPVPMKAVYIEYRFDGTLSATSRAIV